MQKKKKLQKRDDEKEKEMQKGRKNEKTDNFWKKHPKIKSIFEN